MRTEKINRIGLLLAAPAIAFASGCASVNEVHYLQSVDKAGRPVNFFRLTVSGDAQLSRARYISGYFDNRAVDLFFDEYSVHGSGDIRRFLASPPTPDAKSEGAGSGTGGKAKLDSDTPPKAEKVTPLGTDGASESKSLVLVISTNAQNAISQISSFVDSQVFAETLALVANKEQFQAMRRTKDESETTDLRFASLQAELSPMYTRIVAAKNVKELEAVVLEVIEAIVSAIEGPTRFKDFPEARSAVERLVVASRSVK